MGKRINFSESEAAKIISESLDKKKVLLHCGAHSYLGSSMPPTTRGCTGCWKAYYWYMIASTPPHLRQERLDQLISLVRTANQAVEDGTFELELYNHPEIKIERDVQDILAASKE